MNLTLANPALLPLAALIAVPVLIHLFARTRPRALPFSSIRFIEQIVRKTSRIQRPRSWVILLLRTLFFAALIGVFLNPLLMARFPLPGAGERKNVILIIDASASMAAGEGSRTRFAAACARASEIVSGLAPGDLANIVWMRAASVSEFPTLAVSKPALQQALQGAGVSLETADIPGAFQRAEALLRDTTGSREIFVLSDFPEAEWKNHPSSVPPDTRLVLIQTGSRDVPNQALLEIFPSSQKVLVGEDVELTCRVANFSNDPVLRRVFLRAGEITQSRDLRLSPWSEGSVTFVCRFSRAGEQPVEFSLEEDDFPADNTRRILLDVSPYFSVAVTGPDTATAAAWTRALESVDWIRVASVPASGPFDTDVLLLAGWDGAHRNAIKSFLDAGGRVLCAPAADLPLADLATLAGRESPGSAVLESRPQKDPVPIRVANADHPAFALFAGGETGNPAGGRFSERLELSGAPWPEGGVLLAYPDGTPAVAEWGPVIFWNLNITKSAPPWAERVEFVPFLAELLLSSRGGASGTNVGEFPSGTKISRTLPSDTLDQDVHITGPQGVIAAERTGLASSVFTSPVPPPPGLYEWMVRDSPAGFSLVNFPTGESDLRVTGPPAAPTPDTVTLSANQSVSALREGVPLWPWLLGLACACVFAESLVVWKTRPTP